MSSVKILITLFWIRITLLEDHLEDSSHILDEYFYLSHYISQPFSYNGPQCTYYSSVYWTEDVGNEVAKINIDFKNSWTSFENVKNGVNKVNISFGTQDPFFM